MSEEEKIYPYRRSPFFILVLVFIFWILIQTISFLFSSSYFHLNNLYYYFSSLIFTIILLYSVHESFKNNPYMIIKENMIYIHPNAYIGKKVIDIYKIVQIERPSIKKTIIFYHDKNDILKKAVIGRLRLNVLDQIELNDYIKEKRGIKFEVVD